MMSRWEIGSEFHWNEEHLGCQAPIDLAPAGAVLFARGVGALMALMVQSSSAGRRPRIHLPSYFCIDVAERLATVCDVRWFSDLPTQASPDFASLNPSAGDFVLALNFFGQWTSARWAGFAKPPGVMVIEDHSHDPLSNWAQASDAEYALVSLRKTLPTPDGAWLWSPKGLPVPAPKGDEPIGATTKLAAMVLKAAYLRGAAIDKAAFRALQIEGEEGLDEPPLAPASRFTAAILRTIDIPNLHARRVANNMRLQERLLGNTIDGIAVLRPAGANNVVTFSPVLLCDSRVTRDALRAHLQVQAVFAPNHWPQAIDGYNSGDTQAMDLAGRLLTIPVDFRYHPVDVDRVAEIVLAFRLEAERVEPH